MTLLALGMTLFALESVSAQQTDVIRGRVTGPDNAAIVGATVRATSYPGGVAKSTTTDRNGQFTIVFTNGEGDYWIDYLKLGFLPQRREIRRIGEEVVLIANTRMQSAILTLDTMVSRGQRLPPSRGLPNRNAASPDVGGGVRPLISGDLAADQLGNLAAMAGLISGIQVIPGLDGAADMYSALGLSGDQNNVTLDGLGSGVTFLPPDIIAKTSIAPYSFDPSLGGFSGAQISIQSQSGTNFSRRLLSHTNILPALEWSDATGAAQSRKYTSLRVGGNAAGPLALDKAFYNTAYNVSRRFTEARTLINTSDVGLAAAGVSADSVARMLGILAGHGIPIALDGVPRLQAQTGVQGSANLNLTPSASGHSLTVSAQGNFQRSEPVGQNGLLLSTPGHGALSEQWSGNGTLSHTTYVSPFGIGMLSVTNVGGAVSRSRVDPYLDLPQGSVRLRSDLGDGTSPVRSLLFGGGLSQSARHRESAEVGSALSWYSNDNTHTFKLAMVGRRIASGEDDDGGRLGAFTFNSLDDLAAGRPATFTRALSPRTQSAAVLSGAASLGDYWRPKESLQLQYGVRVDGTHFVTVPAFNDSVLAGFGLRNDRVPNAVYLSPRVGLQWAYGPPPTVSYAPGAARPPRAVIHAGVGVFQNIAGPDLIANALASTGLASSFQSMTCAGAAAPTPDWRAYQASLDSIPSQCADGSAGTVFSSSSPSVWLFDHRYRQQRSLRGAADWSGPILDNRFVLGVQGVVNHALAQPGVVDINVDTTRRFALASEGGRPVFADPSAIVEQTGVIAPADGRVLPAFQRVNVAQSDLGLDSRMLSINLKPVTANRRLQWDVTYTLLDGQQSFYGFSSAAGNPFHVERGRLLNRGRHSISAAWRSLPLFDLVYLSVGLRVMSGAPYTPRVTGDINGDGISNDRAFVFDPFAASTDSALASSMQSLLETGPAAARECLQRQLGRVAERGSCQSPWTVTGGLSIRFNPTKIGLPKRTTVSLSLQNPLALADLALHGSRDTRGWGQVIAPDQTLLFVRGFDAATRQFKYDLNQRFGSTRPSQAAEGGLSFLSIAVSMDIGVPRERQTLTQRLDAGRVRPGPLAGDLAIWQLGVASIPNPMSMILSQADSLRLTRAQADSLAQLSHAFSVFADSIWTPAARQLAALPGEYDRGDAYRRYVRAREKTVDFLLTLARQAKGVLTGSQRRKLPLEISNYLDERVLRFLRSSSAGTM